MKFDDLPVKQWEKYPFKLAWGTGDPNQERQFYVDDHYIYKLWSPRYSVKDMYITGNKYSKWDYGNRPKSIASIDIGFMNRNIASALVDLIWQGEQCVGYVTEKRNKVTKIPQNFYEQVLKQSLKTGYFYVDFCTKNVCEINGVYSLIDYDTPLTELASLNYDFEVKSGVFRNHVDVRYRDKIMSLIVKE